jgi:hypothetical protein
VNKPLVYALGGAVVTSAIVASVMAWRKTQALQTRVEHIQSSVMGDALAMSQLERDAARMVDELEAEATAYADTVATAAAERYIGTVYGLTPERMAKVGQLAERLGV